MEHFHFKITDGGKTKLSKRIIPTQFKSILFSRILIYEQWKISLGNVFLQKIKKLTFFTNFGKFSHISELLQLEIANTTQYHEYFPAALIIYRDEGAAALRINVFFAGNSLHSLPATLNLISNFELQLIPNANYRIRTTNAPMHR